MIFEYDFYNNNNNNNNGDVMMDEEDEFYEIVKPAKLFIDLVSSDDKPLARPANGEVKPPPPKLSRSERESRTFNALFCTILVDAGRFSEKRLGISRSVRTRSTAA